MSAERMQLIKDALGMDALVARLEVYFERKLDDVAEHRRLHGRLPTRSSDNELYSWLQNRRGDFKAGLMPESNAQRLDTVLGVEWKSEFKNGTV